MRVFGSLTSRSLIEIKKTTSSIPIRIISLKLSDFTGEDRLLLLCQPSSDRLSRPQMCGENYKSMKTKLSWAFCRTAVERSNYMQAFQVGIKAALWCVELVKWGCDGVWEFSVKRWTHCSVQLISTEALNPECNRRLLMIRQHVTGNLVLSFVAPVR